LSPAPLRLIFYPVLYAQVSVTRWWKEHSDIAPDIIAIRRIQARIIDIMACWYCTALTRFSFWPDWFAELCFQCSI